jgi:hypothetical protein
MNPARLLRYGAATAGAGALGFGAWSALAWVRYGHVDPTRHPRDELLDRFLPNPEVDEYHQIKVRAPAAITLAAAKETDLQTAPIANAIFWLRAIPVLLRGEPFRPQGSRGIVAETLGLGWGVLAEEPDRAIVVGAYTQPWHEQVTFHPLPPEDFAGFNQPGYVKIAWTLRAVPVGPNRSLLVTRTRAVATDPESRKRFRRYWAPMSAGIILIRYAGLPRMRNKAERRAAHAGPERQRGVGSGRGGVVIEHAVDIQRSPEEVFDYCTDLGREPEWNPRTRRIHKLTSVLLKPTPGQSDDALAADLQGQFLPQSLVATRVRQTVEKGFVATRSFFHLMQGFLALGLRPPAARPPRPARARSACRSACCWRSASHSANPDAGASGCRAARAARRSATTWCGERRRPSPGPGCPRG